MMHPVQWYRDGDYYKKHGTLYDDDTPPMEERPLVEFPDGEKIPTNYDAFYPTVPIEYGMVIDTKTDLDRDTGRRTIWYYGEAYIRGVGRRTIYSSWQHPSLAIAIQECAKAIQNHLKMHPDTFA